MTAYTPNPTPPAAEAIAPAELSPAVAGGRHAGVLAQPTQVRRPWRSVARTSFQALVGLAAIAPAVKAAVEEATGYDLDGIPFVVVVLAGAAAVTRVMALPAVERFLRRFAPFLAAAPRPTLKEIS